jgi:hypothetical protein
MLGVLYWLLDLPAFYVRGVASFLRSIGGIISWCNTVLQIFFGVMFFAEKYVLHKYAKVVCTTSLKFLLYIIYFTVFDIGICNIVFCSDVLLTDALCCLHFFTFGMCGFFCANYSLFMEHSFADKRC